MRRRIASHAGYWWLVVLLVLCLGIVPAVVSHAATSGNLLKNPGFEGGDKQPDAWRVVCPDPAAFAFARDASDAYEGEIIFGAQFLDNFRRDPCQSKVDLFGLHQKLPFSFLHGGNRAENILILSGAGG